MKNQILGLIRQVLTFVGMYLVAQGVGTEGLFTEAIGAVMTISFSVWGWIDKSNRDLAVWMSVVRHTLSAAGGFVMSYNLIPDALWNDIVSIVVASFSIILSTIENKKA